MAKADIVTPEGIKITLTGAPAEIAAVLKDIKSKGGTTRREVHKPKTKNNAPTIPNLIDELKKEGFFKKTKKLGEVRNRLAELGHNYPLTTLSGAMQNEASKRRLRRFMQAGKYVYAQ